MKWVIIVEGIKNGSDINMEKKGRIKQAGVTLGTTIAILVVIGIVLNANFGNIVQPTEKEEWQMIYRWTPLGAENDPGTGASGFLQIFCINNTADMNTSMYENDSNVLMSWCDANMVAHNSSATADAFSVEIESEKTFAIVIRCRFNKTNCGQGSDFWDTRTDCQLTMSCTSWNDGNDEANTSARDVGAAVVSSNNSAHDFIYINFCWNADDDAGYQLSDDATLTITEIYIEGKW